MSFSKIDSFACHDWEKVKVTEMGHVTEVLYMAFKNDIPRILKLDKDHYVVIGPDGDITGEVKEFQHFENRASSANSLRQTFRKLRNIINSNVVDVDRVRFFTLTYAQPDGQPMTDAERLYHDFERFHKRFKRYLKGQGVVQPEYINVVEPQASGAWHCHVLYIWPDGEVPYLPNALIREMWGQGFVTVRALRDKLGRACDNVGAYLTAYLGDLAIQEAMDINMDITAFEVKEVPDEEVGERKSKYFLKGARLFLYPPGMNIFRCSRGVKRPVEEFETWGKAKEKASAATLTFSSHLHLGFEKGRVNVISKRYYNNAVQGRQAVTDGIRYDVETGEVLDDERAVHSWDVAPLVDETQRWINRNIRDLKPWEVDDLPWPVDYDKLAEDAGER